MNLVNNTYNSAEEKNFKKQELKRKTKLKFCRKKMSNYYDEMNIRRQHDNFQFEEDPFSKDPFRSF